MSVRRRRARRRDRPLTDALTLFAPESVETGVNPRVHTVQFAPRTWVGWFLAAVVGLVLFAAAAVFVTAALIAGFVIAAVLLGRVWWLTRKVKRSRAEEYLSAEYRVQRETGRLAEPPTNPDRTRE